MPVAEAQTPAAQTRPVFRLSVDAYHRMIDAGVFDEDDRVELIDGELRAMPPIKSDHAGKTTRLNRLLTLGAGDSALVAVQNPITLRAFSEPEPDLMLLRPRDDFYEGDNPTSADTLLVIEVSDSSVRYDREVKVPLYAAHGVPEVWLVDLPQRCLEIYREPGPDGYRLMLRPQGSEVITPALLPGLRIPVADIW
ncbi:MAG: Uma2 family endonuclease [Gammaproteobacteria bacterium]|jgi:Uma2 family endonuclease|nr:Uma2 family endonuclease [Gammaproteobacteria bacterium]